MKARYVAYYRVSTQQQGRSGLGLEAQQQAVMDYLRDRPHKLVGEHTEIESGKRSDRPQLEKALADCRLKGAALVVAKLDRLARDAAFLSKVVKESGERGVVFCDLPSIPEGATGKFLIGVMAQVAELEGGLISERTKAALAAAKARGKKLGGDRGNIRSIQPQGTIASVAVRIQKAAQFHADVLPMASELRREGKSLRAICGVLNAEEVRAPRGGSWNATTLSRILARNIE